MNIKQKVRIKLRHMNTDIFSNQILLELINCIFFIYSNEDHPSKRIKAKRYHLLKGFINNYNVIINGKNFYDQPLDSDVKRYKEMRKLTSGQAEDCTTGCLLDYDYIKNQYRLIAATLNRQKELDPDPKAIQEIEFVGQLKKLNKYNNNDESMFVLEF